MNLRPLSNPSPATEPHAARARSRRRLRLGAVALGVFGFAAALTATAQVEQCERCRIEWESCLLHAESPMQAQGCDTRYSNCLRPLDCPAPEAR